MGKAGQCSPVPQLRWHPISSNNIWHVAVLAVSTSLVGDACGSVLMLKHSCTVLSASRCCVWLPSQFYRDYDRALNGYMGVDSGIGMDLTLVSKQWMMSRHWINERTKGRL